MGSSARNWGCSSELEWVGGGDGFVGVERLRMWWGVGGESAGTCACN